MADPRDDVIRELANARGSLMRAISMVMLIDSRITDGRKWANMFPLTNIDMMLESTIRQVIDEMRRDHSTDMPMNWGGDK